ncbi:MAG: pitrilysin family protein [Actinomycetia bacterium]|nr:pitrilysin family protein [Actinomycetes bacterium]
MSSTSPRPEVSPPGPWEFPSPTSEHRLDNGLRLVTYDVPGQYVITATLVVPLPLSSEPTALEGVAALMSSLLDEGTMRHSSEEFATLLERHGVALSAGVNDGGLMVDVDVPLRHLSAALDLMTQAVAEPAFPAAEVGRLRNARLAEIEQERVSAPHRAARELIATLWAPHERASRPTAGSRATVEAITAQDVAAFHAERVGPQGASLVVAGAIADTDVLDMVERTLGTWAAPGHLVAEAPRAPQLAEDAARVVLVDRPGSVQSEISLAWHGPDRHVEGGWAPYPVIGFVLGGSPNARIDAVLREEKGYTYGIRSGFRPRRAGGLMLTSGSVRADATVDSLRLLVELLDPGQVTFTEEEVRSGVDFIAGTAPGRYATADAIAGEALSLILDQLPLDFTTTTREAMMGLSAVQLTSTYATWAPQQWCVIVVGDAESLAQPLRELGIGEVTVVAT